MMNRPFRLSNFSTKRHVNLIEFSPGDLASTVSFKGDVYPVVILENSLAADEQKLTSLMSSSGRITYSSNTFLRFWSPQFIEDPKMMESKERLQGKLRVFSSNMLGILEDKKESFKEISMDILNEKGYLYEEDLYEKIFSDRGKEFIEGDFAIHKFLFESTENWIKDGQWSLMSSQSRGPYTLRPKWQLDLLKETSKIISSEPDSLKRFQLKVSDSLKTGKLFKTDNNYEEHFLKCLKVFSEEFYVNVQKFSIPNPFKEIVQTLFLGVSIVDTQSQAKELFEKLCESFNFSLSKPLSNSFLNSERDIGKFLIKEYSESSSELETVDFGTLPVYLIDPVGTVEVDDGISVERTNDSNEEAILHVHVSDPSDFISGPVEEEAKRRAGTLYLPEKKIPMLPERITQLSTLKEIGVKTLTFSCKINLKTGEMSEQKIRQGIIRKLNHMTYEEADGTIHDNPDIELLKRISSAHLKYRKLRGHLDFSFPRGLAHLDEKNEKIWIEIEGTGVEMKKIVAEAMIIAGRIAGDKLKENGIPAPFRNHPGINSKYSEDENVNLSLLEKYEILKMIPSASVSSSPHPHRYMGLDSYVKVTSPLRRYLDLVTHKIIKRPGKTIYDSGWFNNNLEKIKRQEFYNKKLGFSVNRYWIERFIWQEIGSNLDIALWTLTPLERIKEGMWCVHVEEVSNNFIVRIQSNYGEINLGECVKGRIVSKSRDTIMKFEVIKG